MNKLTIKIRIMKADDFNAVVAIDQKVFKVSRPEYYRVKFERLILSENCVPTSLVAELEDATVVGFIMGELFIGDYGISEEDATLDSIAVDPDYQHMGIGKRLIDEFMDHLRTLRVRKISTLVSWNDFIMIHFFSANQFNPSRTINLERNLFDEE